MFKGCTAVLNKDMAVNLKKYEKELKDAFNDVLNEKTDTNWYE